MPDKAGESSVLPLAILKIRNQHDAMPLHFIVSQFYLHAFRGRPHSGVILAGRANDPVNAVVGMIGIMVEKNEFPGPAFHHNIDCLAPMAMAPAALVRLIFLRKILGVVDQHVGALRQFPDVLIEDDMSRFVVGRVNEHLPAGFEPEPKTALRVIEPHRFNQAVVKGNLTFFDVVELPVGRHLVHVDRKIRIGHLLFNGPLQASTAVGGVKEKMALTVGIERRKKRDSLNVVPVEMRKKYVCGNRMSIGFLYQLLTQIAEAGPTIKNVDLAVQAHLDA